MTDTQIHDRFKEILREELGDVLRNKETSREIKHRIVDKVISALLGRAEEQRKAAGAP